MTQIMGAIYQRDSACFGIHLNPAKVIKTAVKNTFGKGAKKSVLGLEEDSSGKEF